MNGESQAEPGNSLADRRKQKSTDLISQEALSDVDLKGKKTKMVIEAKGLLLPYWLLPLPLLPFPYLLFHPPSDVSHPLVVAHHCSRSLTPMALKIN